MAKIKRKVKQENANKAMKVMDFETFYDRVTRQTVVFNERITVIEAYAMSKSLYEKRLRSMSEISHMMRHGPYYIDQIIDRFDKRDWEAIARGDTKYTPPEEEKS